MNRRQFVFGLGTATVGGSVLLGTGAYSRTDSQRDMTIEVVGDEDAYLRLEYNNEIAFDCETEMTLLWVTNQLKSEISGLTFEVVGETGDIEIDVVEVPDSLEIGEQGEIVALLSCEGADAERTANFEIEVTGEDLEVSAHRTDALALTCECREESAWVLRAEGDKTTYPTRNRLDGIPGVQRWGWYVPYTIGSEPVEAELWAGAARNDLDAGTHVGNVTIDDDENVLTIETVPFEEGVLERSHCYIDTDTGRLGDLGAAPGRFDYSSDGGSYEIPLPDVADDLSNGDELVLAIHGGVRC